MFCFLFQYNEFGQKMDLLANLYIIHGLNKQKLNGPERKKRWEKVRADYMNECGENITKQKLEKRWNNQITLLKTKARKYKTNVKQTGELCSEFQK